MLKWLFLFLLSLPFAGASSHCTAITSLPYTISVPGSYCINRSFSSVAPPDLSGAVTINADNVVFDCQGSTISGTSELDKHGIYFNGTSFSSAKNCLVSSFDFGVFLDSSMNASISNVTANSNEEGFVIEGNGSRIENSSASNNAGNGFLIELSSSENLIANSTSSYNILDGYVISLSDKNSIVDSVADGNSAGFSISLSSYRNSITSSTARNNLYGFYVFSSHNNTVSGAAGQNTQGFRLSGGSSNNTISGSGESNSKGITMYSGWNLVRSYSDSTSSVGVLVCSSGNVLELSSLSSPRGVVIGDCANANATEIRGSSVSQISHSGTGSSFIANTTVGSYNITSGALYIQHYLDLLAVDNSSVPLASSLSVFGSYQHLNPTATYVSLPPSSYRMVASEQFMNSSHSLSFNPYILNFSKVGYESNSTEINMTGLSSVTVVLSVQTSTTTTSTTIITTTTADSSSGGVDSTTTTSVSATTSSVTTTHRDLMKDASGQIERARKAVASVEDPRIFAEASQLLAKAEEFLLKGDYMTSMLFAQEAEKISHEDVKKVVSTTVSLAPSGKTEDNSIVFWAVIVLLALIAISRKK